MGQLNSGAGDCKGAAVASVIVAVSKLGQAGHIFERISKISRSGGTSTIASSLQMQRSLSQHRRLNARV